MTSILIANTSANRQQIEVESTEGSERVQFIHGYFSEKEVKEQNLNVLKSFFSSLITHDEVYITPPLLNLVLGQYGADDFIKIMNTTSVKVCSGLGSNVAILGNEESSLSSIYHQSSDINIFEKVLTKKVSPQNKNFNLAMQYVENSSIDLDKDYTELAVKEISGDFSSDIIRSSLGISSLTPQNIKPVDIYRTLRMADIIQGFILQTKLNITSIYQDGYSSSYIKAKLGALSPKIGSDPTKTFSKILSMKGVPDIHALYSTGIIEIEDILRYRNSSNGELFRKWYASQDYDETEVIKGLINKENEKKVSKFIRFLYPNVFGLVSPVMGAASAGFDSYILTRILEGWNPSLFLDDVLKRNIDDKVRVYEDQKKRDQFISRFGSIERNEPCPCQSGKKYKKCHGM